MVREELPDWLDERGFDTSRIAGWGWSMGGYGVLRLAQAQPGWLSAVAAFSPAVSIGGPVAADVDRLAGQTLGLWCGTQDSFYPAVKDLAERLRPPPAITSFTPGRHTRTYWNDQTPAAMALIGNSLEAA